MDWGRNNYREFPWRKPTVSPYESIVAEMLLRRTRAETVKKVYLHFTHQYPDFISLSKASVSDLKELLNPIGFSNVRSNAFKEIATTVTRDHNGALPADETYISNLPHCGRYTANAVLCFSFGQKRAIIDAPIHRMMCRHLGFLPVTEIHKADELWDFMARLVPESYPRECNYALLDYCAIVCTPRVCKCSNSIVLNEIDRNTIFDE